MRISKPPAVHGPACRAAVLVALGLALALGSGARPERPPAGDLQRAASLRPSQGYWLLAADGGTFTFGDARFLGPNRNQGRDIAAMGRTPDGTGLWAVDDDGDVFHYGTALNYGSRLLDVDDVVGFAARPAGDGYWMATRDGAIFSFGRAGFHGPADPLHLNRPIVDMAATPSGNGYWLVASDGGIFTFGDARFFGSTGHIPLNRPIVGMAATPSGNGYWLVASDGGIFTFGDARFFGSTGGMALNQPIVGMVATPVRWVSILPVAVPDSAVVAEDASVAVPVLANDSGLEDGGIAVSVIDPPDHGSAVVDGDGRIRYTPHPDYHGPDLLTYRVIDVDGEPATAMVTISVSARNDPPTAPNQSLSTNEDVRLNGSVGGIDIDGDQLAYALIGAPADGTVSVTGWGDFTYLPATDYHGSDQFAIAVSDGHGGSAVAVIDVTVTPVGDPPTISAMADTATLEDTPVTVGFTVGDPETPAASLTVGATSSNQSVVANGGIAFSGSGTTRTLTATPALNASGSATITVTVSDGASMAAESFVLTVNAVNDPPAVSAIPDTVTVEDIAVTLALTVGDAESPAASLTLSGTSSNQSVVPGGGIAFAGSGANRTVTVTPASNAFGSATVTVTVTDGNLTASEAFLLTVSAVNDPPAISAIADTTTNEDVPVTLAFTVGDVETAAGALTVAGTSSNPAVVGAGGLSFEGSGANRTVTATPVANASGSTTITVTAFDGGTTTAESFVLTVAGVNDPPAISAIADTATAEDTPVTIGFTVGDTETPAASLTLTGTSSTQSVVANAGITFGGSGASRTVTVAPVANASGTAAITVTVSDGGASAAESFVLTVTTVNDPPTISAIADTTTNEDVPVTLAFTVGDSESAPGSLAVTGTSSNQAVVADAGITFAGSGANRTVTLTPVANASGTTTVTVTVTDGTLTTTEPFVLTVSAVNDPPTISAIGNTATDEDVPVVIGFTVGDTETPSGSLTVTGSSNDQAVVANADITFTGSGADRTVTITPVANAAGTATIRITVSDGGAETLESFFLTVSPVNDAAPTISAIADTTTAEDTPVTLAFTIGDTETPAGLLVLSGTSSTPSVVANAGITFAGSGADRTITLTPVANASGTATITVTVTDGTLSATEVFAVTVTPVNDDPPTISSIASMGTDEDVPVVIGFTVGDTETPAGSLTVSGSSSTQSVVADAGITFAGSGANRTVAISPVADASGTATISITVSDGTLTSTESFVLTVTAVNDQPTISSITNTATPVNVAVSIDFVVDDAESPAGSLVLTATSSNQAVVADSDMTFEGSGANRTITVTPVLGASGVTTITVTVSDGTAVRDEVFDLTVT